MSDRGPILLAESDRHRVTQQLHDDPARARDQILALATRVPPDCTWMVVQNSTVALAHLRHWGCECSQASTTQVERD